MLDDETKMETIGHKSDKQLADEARLQSAFKNFKFSSKHIQYITRLINEVSRDYTEADILPRIIDLERKCVDLKHRMEMRDQGHDTKDDHHDEEIRAVHKTLSSIKKSFEKEIKEEEDARASCVSEINKAIKDGRKEDKEANEKLVKVIGFILVVIIAVLELFQ